MKSSKLNRYVLVLYALIGSFHILFHQHPAIHHFTKPLLMPLLLLYAFGAFHSLGSRPPLALIVALIASFFGDSFLMYETHKPVYFVLGLGSFLLAHLAYIILFLKTAEPYPFILRIKSRWIMAGVLITYAAGLLVVLLPKAEDLQVPLITYALVLCIMALTAYLRAGKHWKAHSLLVCLGSILFVISDSLLAVNKFIVTLPYAPVWIMGTYLTAQYWIVRGVVLREEENRLPKKVE